MTASQEIIEPYEMNAFNNTGLFSNHYLINMIHKIPEWGCDDAHLWEIYIQIKEVFDRKMKNFESYVEADLEHNWIRPVLEILGHHFGVQEGLHHDPLKPDYAFFPDQKTLEEAYSKKKDAEDFYKKSIVVGDAKAWNVALDKSRQGKAYREMTNPSFQIDVYLRATPPKWAILTNGRLWRLYHEDTSVKMDCYYEVDLPEIIRSINEGGKIENFKYFYLFFRLEAFPQIPLGSSFLDRVREESAAYAQKIGNDLQDNVYKAMKILSEGFFAESSNSLSSSAEDVKEVQDNSLRLLYRLLFIFYAESRKLLNTDNKHYREMSLRKMKEDISRKIDQGESILAVRSTYWEGLKDLFRLINDGSEAYGYPKEEFYIPAYNGGLFDPAENTFLAEKRIGNSYLAEAIDLLARSKGENGMAFVDYSSLNIRHLGSIYEGILEYKLHLAEEPMVAIKEKGKEIWLPKREAKNRKISDTVESGRLYLVTDKGERKATGSYYTPEYIVKYIVKNTLAPIIDPMMEGAIWSDDEKKNLLSKLLSIKVLDPAMGSGHFLVEATDYIAREIIHAKEIARREELETEDVAEHDVHWARREVVRNCIYGVDLNPMAVELAKLSLWLTTMAANKPLSFLNHHLICGNSLVNVDLEALITFPGEEKVKGTQSDDVTEINNKIRAKDLARIKKVSKDEKQVSLRTFFERLVKQNADTLIRQYKEIAARPDDDLKTIKDKEAGFKKIQTSELNRRLKELANVWLSSHFDNHVSKEDYYDLRDHLSVEMFPDWSRFRSEGWFKHAQDIASKRRFFNWELEFPEAFQGKGHGFDVVIGNPPWLMVQVIDELDRNYYRKLFRTAEGKFDIYALFIEQGLKRLNRDCHLGFIVSNKFLKAGYGKRLRDLILDNCAIEKLIDYSDLPLFGDATNYSLVIILKNTIAEEGHMFDALVFKDNLRGLKESEIKTIATRFESSEYARTFQVNQSLIHKGYNWDLAPDSSINIIKKVNDLSIPLYTFCSTICKGIWTGKKDVFVDGIKHGLSEDGKIEQELVVPVIDGRDIERYFYDTGSQKYILYPYKIDNHELELIDIEEFPNAKAYLEKHRYDLEQRRNWGQTILEAGKKYYEIWNPSPYLQKKKILTQDISERNKFALDEEGGYLAMDTCYALVLRDDLSDSPKFLLSLLNSKLLNFVFSFISPKIQGGFFRYKKQYIEPLPIRRISFTTPEFERHRRAEELKVLYHAGRVGEVLDRVEECLPKNEVGEFVAEDEMSDVVHDLLAHLAEEMIRMNKEKLNEIKKFLGWLENDMGAKVEDLTNKTKIQAYYEIEFPEFLAVLNKNKKKIQVDYSRYDPNSRLLEAFNTSLSRLKPLIAKIEETDRLIDQVVYKLYGLTDEEIKMVEDAIAK